MLNTVTKFNRLSAEEKWLFIKTCYYFIFFWVVILLFPFKFYKRFLGQPENDTPEISNSEEEKMVTYTYRAVNRAARYLPFPRKCLIEAMVAKRLLEKQNIKTTLYLGVAKDGSKEIIAHAWLRWGEKIITGNKGVPKYKIVSKFS
jgi:hypothetical protein